MTTSPSRWVSRRRAAGLAQAALWLGIPFLEVGGESALRFDVPTLRLHVLGASLALDELYPVLAVTLLATFAFLLATLVLGRAWCGWACPQTVLADLTAPFDRWRHRGGARAAAAWLGLALGSAVVGASLVWYFVAPGPFARGLLAGTLHPWAWGSWAVLSLVLFLDLAFLRARFCATACPYARLQGVLFDRHSLVVAYDAGRAADCIDCGACVRCCPTGIDIRRGLQMECIACAACIDACQPIMRKLRRPPDLVGYFFGQPGGRARLRRPAVLALSALTAAALVLLAASAAARTPLDLRVEPAAGFAPRRGADGAAVNAFEVTLENRDRAPATLRLWLESPGVEVSLRPQEVTLAPGELRRLRVLALVASPGPEARVVAGALRAVSPAGRGPAPRPVELRVPAEKGRGEEQAR
ncbi:MAG: 4Fe-4S binding protein [Deltaproteobacteria bacterium]|nr:4Fe-4S binding protein [Deltaproteobacteria bacterium]